MYKKGKKFGSVLIARSQLGVRGVFILNRIRIRSKIFIFIYI